MQIDSLAESSSAIAIARFVGPMCFVWSRQSEKRQSRSAISIPAINILKYDVGSTAFEYIEGFKSIVASVLDRPLLLCAIQVA